MNCKVLLAATALATSLITGAAFAESNHDHNGKAGSNDQAVMMQDDCPMMKQMHGGMMGGGMMQKLDTDGDGTVTPDEMRAQLQAKLTEYDKNADGNLSIAEFEALHSAMIREMMVDKFQHLDADGDGAITSEEMTAHADMMERMQKMRGKKHGQKGGHGAMKSDN